MLGTGVILTPALFLLHPEAQNIVVALLSLAKATHLRGLVRHLDQEQKEYANQGCQQKLNVEFD